MVGCVWLPPVASPLLGDAFLAYCRLLAGHHFQGPPSTPLPAPSPSRLVTCSGISYLYCVDILSCTSHAGRRLVVVFTPGIFTVFVRILA